MNIKDYLAQKKIEMTKEPSKVIGVKVKVKVEDIIAEYPNGFSVCAFDILKSKEYGDLVPINIKEDDGIYSYAPKMLRDILIDMVDKVFNGNIETANKILNDEPIRVKYELKTSTKTGNNYILVTLI